MLIDKREGFDVRKRLLIIYKTFPENPVKKKVEHEVLGRSSGKSEKDRMLQTEICVPFHQNHL